MNLMTSVNHAFNAALHAVYPALQPPENALRSNARDITLMWTAAPAIAKQLKQPAAQLAEEIAKHFVSDDATVTVKPTGMIIVAIKTNAIAARLHSMDSDERLGVPLASPRKRVIVEFSSPNVAKQLHVGHLRSTIIGEVLARVQEFLGQDVLRLNHIGDWGTQFGQLICYIKENNLLDSVSSFALSDLMKCYREASALFKSDDAFKIRAREAVVRLQSGEEESIAVWKKICEVSRKDYEEIYRLLDVTLVERGESFYNPMLRPLVDDLLAREIAEISQGATIARTTMGSEAFMLRKSDGGFTYDTTDIAALQHRIATEHAERIIYVVDSGQSEHFLQLWEVGEKAGILDRAKVDVQHVGFGTVNGPDGKKYKTRSGDVALLRDLLEEAIAKAGAVLVEKGIVDEQAAKTLGIGAIKYADLRNDRKTGYIFTPDQMMDFNGNSIAYILYMLARIRSMKKKINKESSSDQPFTLTSDTEIALGLYLLNFPEVVAEVDRLLEPHHLCTFLYNVATKFSKFYIDCKVEGDPQEASRLRFCNLVQKVMEKSLSLLAIGTLDNM